MKPIKHIKSWQLHVLETDAAKVFKAKQIRPDIKMDKIAVLTGTIVNDPTENLKIGDHTRTTVIIESKKDNIYETANTIYKVLGKQGDTVINGGDWGSRVMEIIYG